MRSDTPNLFFIGSLLGSAGGLIRSILLKHCYLSNSKGLRDIQTNTLDIIQNAFGASKLIKDHLVFIYVSLLGIFCCLVLDYYLGTARFQSVKYKALQVTPFLYIGSHFICPPRWWVLVLELLQSYKIFLE